MMQVCVRRGVLCSLRRALSVRCLSAAPAPQIDSDGGVAAVPDHVLSIADQICALSLHETGQLTKLLKERLGETWKLQLFVIILCLALLFCTFPFRSIHKFAI